MVSAHLRSHHITLHIGQATRQNQDLIRVNQALRAGRSPEMGEALTTPVEPLPASTHLQSELIHQAVGCPHGWMDAKVVLFIAKDLFSL